MIQKAPDKHCELDPAPTWLVKQCSNILAPVIALLTNRSFQEASFPEGGKVAIVKPILKKPNLDPFDLKSWRPISNIGFASKIVERLAIRRFNQHVSTHDLLPKYQSAYRPHYSTETAISVVFNDIARTVDAGQICTMVMLDLSAAFDTVDHGILMSVLERRFACRDAVKEWFHSYLTGRTQTYRVRSSSVPTRLMCGVPQGSIIGPSQFTAYTEDVEDVINPMPHHLYADDTQILAKATIQSIGTCCQELETRILSVQRWCAARRLQLNPDKTEFICFGSTVQLQRLHTSNVSINVNGVVIKPVDSVRDLGVHLDSRLDMRSHISKIVSTCFFHLRRLRHLRHTVDRDVRQRLVSALILSRIDYCNVVFAALPSVALVPLRRAMNAAVRFVAGLGPRDHTSDAQRELHWLPIEQRITYKLCVLMHAVETGTAPEYISDMVKPVSVLEGRAHLRSATLGLYDIPRTRTLIGSKAFSVAGPIAWNSLPQSIRNIKSAFTFKRHLKTHLFKCAYN